MGNGKTSVVAATVVALVLTTILAYFMSMENESGALCKTKACINAATRVLNSLDTMYDPCNKFYQYSCAGWLKNNPIPEDKPTINQFSFTAERTQKHLRELLSTDSSNDRDAIKKAKTFYKACVDQDIVEKLGAQPALNLIKNYGGLPLFGDEFDVESFSLEMLLARAKNRLYDSFFAISSPLINMDVKTDDRNSSSYVITLDQPLLGITNSDSYVNSESNATLLGYKTYMRDYLAELWKSGNMVNEFGKYNETELGKGVDVIIQLETDLAKIVEPMSARIDILNIYNKMKFEEMPIKISADFDWLKFTNQIMKRVDIKANPKTEVVVYGIPYLSKLMSVLKKYNKRVLQNYVIIYNLIKHNHLLSKKFRDTKAPFNKANLGTAEEKPKWQDCISSANMLLPLPVGAIYVKALFSEENKDTVVEMTEDVIDAFKDDLYKITWMDESTKKFALNKVDQVAKLIGYPEYIVDEDNSRLDDEYKDLFVSEKKYFESEQNLYNFDLDQSLAKLNQPVDRQKWGMGPGQVNAFYNTNFNRMTFPAAILQIPFFDPGQPFAMNFAGVGVAMGHELTHGFDTAGSRYNALGNLEIWWSNSSRKNFEQRESCFRKQYGKFYYEPAEMFVNGNLTIGENIADNGGIRLAYQGYQLWKIKNPGREFQLPGLEGYTHEQLFFIANAQLWCGSDRPEFAKRRLAVFPHSPGIFRAEGSLKNFEKFGQAFGCRKGKDKMYPKQEDTCRVW
ncbi:membrane metallo-endopeptidase-like 1 [Styela clava]